MKNVWVFTILLTILTGSFNCTFAYSEMVEINFDELGYNEIVTNQYESKGITFQLLETPSNYIEGPRTLIPISRYYRGAKRSLPLFPEKGAKGLFISSRQKNTPLFYYDIEMNFNVDVDFFSILAFDTYLNVRCYYNNRLVAIKNNPSRSNRGIYTVEMGEVGGNIIFNRIILDILNPVSPFFVRMSGFDELKYNIRYDIKHDCHEATIHCGEIIDESIDTIDEVDQYIFCAKAGEVVGIGIDGRNANFQPKWQLYNSNGRSIGGESHRYAVRKIKEDGIHIIRVWDYQMDSTGDYKVKLESISGELNENPGCFVHIECGDIINDNIDMKQSSNAYSFSAKAGDVVAIGIDGGNANFQPKWQLYNSNGDSIGGDSFRYAVRKIDEDGLYIIRVWDYQMNSTGDYKVKLESI